MIAWKIKRRNKTVKCQNSNIIHQQLENNCLTCACVSCWKQTKPSSMERNRSFSQVLLNTTKGSLVSTSRALLWSEQNNFIQSQAQYWIPCALKISLEYFCSLYVSLWQWSDSDMIPYIRGKLTKNKTMVLWEFSQSCRGMIRLLSPTQRTTFIKSGIFGKALLICA